MRVVHVVRQFAPQIGGLEDSVRSLARIQRQSLEVDAEVVTLNRIFGSTEILPSQDEIDGVPVRRISWRGSSRYPLAPAVLRQLGDADLLHVHAIDFFFDFLALTRPLHRIPMLASTHGGFFHSNALRLVKRLWLPTITRGSCRAYQRIVACSVSDEAMFRTIAGNRLVTIENGINQEKFNDASSRSRKKTIISFGRFARHKRIERLFELLAALHTGDPDWRLILVGRDADQTATELRAAAERLGVLAAVEFEIGPDDARLRERIAEADYFACLSAHEGFGLAAVEAMSAGLTPILSPITPFVRLAAQTGCGLIVDPDRPDAAAALIRQQLPLSDADHVRRRQDVMTAARIYDWRVVAKTYTDLYDEILGPRRHARASAPAGAWG